MQENHSESKSGQMNSEDYIKLTQHKLAKKPNLQDLSSTLHSYLLLIEVLNLNEMQISCLSLYWEIDSLHHTLFCVKIKLEACLNSRSKNKAHKESNKNSRKQMQRARRVCAIRSKTQNIILNVSISILCVKKPLDEEGHRQSCCYSPHEARLLGQSSCLTEYWIITLLAEYWACFYSFALNKYDVPVWLYKYNIWACAEHHWSWCSTLASTDQVKK